MVPELVLGPRDPQLTDGVPRALATGTFSRCVGIPENTKLNDGADILTELFTGALVKITRKSS